MSVRMIYGRWRYSPCTHAPGTTCLGMDCKAICAQKLMDYRPYFVPNELAEKGKKGKKSNLVGEH